MIFVCSVSYDGKPRCRPCHYKVSHSILNRSIHSCEVYSFDFFGTNLEQNLHYFNQSVVISSTFEISGQFLYRLSMAKQQTKRCSFKIFCISPSIQRAIHFSLYYEPPFSRIKCHNILSSQTLCITSVLQCEHTWRDTELWQPS